MKTEREIDKLMQEALSPEIEPDKALNENLLHMWDGQYSDNASENRCSDMDTDLISDRVDMVYKRKKEHVTKNYFISKKERMSEMKNKRRLSIAAAAAICVLAVSTTVAVAATVRYLSREEIIKEVKDPYAENAFKNGTTLDINQTVETGDYRFRVYSIATQEKLTENGLNEGLEGGTYVIVSIERIDGTSMLDDYHEKTFLVSPLIQGLEPWSYNIFSMGGSYTQKIKDGILYRIIKCDEIALFADRQIYLSILDDTFYQKDAYHYNEVDGTISREESYDGINLLFELPIDKSRADKEKAAQYLRELEKSWEKEIVETGSELLDNIIRQERAKGSNAICIEEIPVEVLISYAKLDEDSVKVLTPRDDGMIEYTYYRKDESGGSDMRALDDFLLRFPDGTGTILIGINFGENSEEEVIFRVFTRDADGIIKGMEYIIKE